MKDKKQHFEALIETYSKAMYLQIRSMVLNHEDADDVLQNALMKAWQKLDQFRENASIKTWLFRIAINEALMHIRKQQKHRKFRLENGDETVGFTNNAIEKDPTQLLELALKHLTEKQRLIFGLRYYNEMTHKEISVITKLAEGTIKATYHQAVKKIEQYLNQYE